MRGKAVQRILGVICLVFGLAGVVLGAVDTIVDQRMEEIFRESQDLHSWGSMGILWGSGASLLGILLVVLTETRSS